MSKPSAPTHPMKPTLTMDLVLVTPQMAEEWLEKNTKNRTLNQTRVCTIAEDISRGSFLTTHQGVAFGVDGALLDGQHRLAAIVKAQAPVWLFVARDVPDGSMPVIDSGRSRSLGDRASLTEGWANGSRVMAVARLLAQVEAGNTTVGDSRIFDVARREHAGIEWVVGLKLRQMRSAPILTALVLARPVVDEAKLREFAERLEDGVMLSPGSPILALRHSLEKNGASKGSRELGGRSAILRRVLCALHAFITGTERARIVDSTTGIDWLYQERRARGLTTDTPK